MDEIVTDLRTAPWQTLCDEKVSLIDYSNGINELPKSNVLAFVGKNIKVTVRPSGTEPKLKLYYSTHADTMDASRVLCAAVRQDMSARIE